MLNAKRSLPGQPGPSPARFRPWLPLLLPLLWLALSGTGTATAANRQPPPLARQGFLDLRGWDFPTAGNIDLNGEWAFYWQQLLTPTDLAAAPPPTAWAKIPGLWNELEVNGRKLPGGGYATYRLRLQLRDNQPLLALRLLDASTSYRLWVNGRPTANNGVVGTEKNSAHPQFLLRIAPLPAQEEELDLVIQVANFSHARGGLWCPLTLGPAGELARAQELKWGLDLFLFGALLIMGGYHLCLFFLRRKDPSLVYFGLFSILIALRTILTENRFLTFLCPNFPWELLFKGELLTVHLSFLLLLGFIDSLYPGECARRIVRPLQGICLACAALTLLAPAKISSLLVLPFQPVILTILAYIVFVLGQAFRRHRSGAVSILVGLLVFFLAVVNDILHNNFLIATAYIAPLGFLFLVASQSWALARRFARAFTTAEQLSTEREEHIQALSRLDQLKDEFLATTSHELRTPLNGIIGLAESLGAGEVGRSNPTAHTHLQMIASSGRRLNNLVNDILDLSRLKNRDIKLRRQAVDLRALAASVLAVSQPLVHGRQLALVNAIPPSLPLADGDEDRLQQVLFNLVGNAIKFTDQGEIVIAATTREEKLEVTVRDSGIGIPAAQLEAIFAAFAQVDGSAGRAQGGVGLGLGISRHLVELHGGRLWAESSPGAGATFRFTLPLATGGSASATPLLGPCPAASPPLLPPAPAAVGVNPLPAPGAPHVLVVDDDPVNLQVVLAHLGTDGIAATTAASGREALALLEQGSHFDLLLLDVMMPGMTGYEVCRTLRHRYNAAELPVIMLTARNRVADLSEGLRSGANDYLGKPFAREELLARVHAQLRVGKAHHLRRENTRLQEELAARRQTELTLRLGQRRLSGMLHALPDRIVAINENREFAFCNQAFEECFGYLAAELLGQPIAKLFAAAAESTVDGWLVAVTSAHGQPPPAGAQLALRTAAGSPWSGLVLPAALELEEERLLILVLSDTPDSSSSLRRRAEHSHNLHQLQQLAVQELTPAVAKQEQRQLLVETMKLTLDLWSASTQESKAELARRSGQWSVYVNQDGWERTQTLDRYLSLDSLPAAPRLKTVLRTVEFVLESCPGATPLRQRLTTALEKLR